MTFLETVFARARLIPPILNYHTLRLVRRRSKKEGLIRTASWFGPLYTLADDPDVSTNIRRRGVYDVPLSTALWSLLQPGMRVINVGANLGFFAILAAKRTRAPVLCFEPDLRSFKALSRNAQLYPLLVPFPFAVGDHTGDVAFIQDSVPGNSALAAATGTSRLVRMVTLDAWMSAPADVLLMDVQGAEGLILRGLGARLRDFQYILFELWPYGLDRTNTTVDEIRQLLHEAGFTIRHLARTQLPDPEAEWAALTSRLRSAKQGRGFCNLLAVRVEAKNTTVAT